MNRKKTTEIHIPVLARESLEYLDPKSGDNFIDATLGMGGHSRMILEKTAPNGKILGLDQDAEAIEIAKGNLDIYNDRVLYIQDNFANINNIAVEHGFNKIKGILFDLGMNSWQLDESGKGFSFFKDEPLDMRFTDRGITAAEILNHCSVKDLAKIFYNYGDIKRNWLLAKKICYGRDKSKMSTTSNLLKIIGSNNPKILAPIFQSLRIAVNNECQNLERGLEGAFEIAERIAVISFHSGEDRIVKNFFREKEKEGRLKILTKKPITASEKEVAANPRARSAKLRAGEIR